MTVSLELIGQIRWNPTLTLSVLSADGERFYFFVESTHRFLGESGTQVWEITNEQTARYFARCFSIPEPQLFIEHCPHFLKLGSPEDAFPSGYSWQMYADGPRHPGDYEDDT